MDYKARREVWKLQHTESLPPLLGQVLRAAFNETLVEYWQGHSLGKVKGAYFIPPVEEQLRLYKLAEERLNPE